MASFTVFRNFLEEAQSKRQISLQWDERQKEKRKDHISFMLFGFFSILRLNLLKDF